MKGVINNMKKTLLGLFTTLMIVGACASCGNNESITNSGMNDGQLGFVDDKYDKDGKLIISFFGIDLDTLQSPTEETTRIINYIQDRFGVSFKYLTSTTSGWQSVLNQYIGAGDVPDIFFHDHQEPAYSSWRSDDNRYLFNFSTYLDDYPHLKEAFKRFPEKEMKAYLGGDYYSYPIVMNDLTDQDKINEHALYYRRDWYTSLVNKGYQPTSGRSLVDPEDESFNYLNFYDLCEGFTKGDPDNNGKDDTYAYAMTKDGGVYWWYPLLSMFNVIWDGWHFNETSNRYEPDCISEEMKEAIWYIADMFDKGFINQNYATTATQPVMKNEFVNGLAGMMCYNATYPMGKGILDLMVQYTSSDLALGDVVRAMPVPTNNEGKKTMFGYRNAYGFRAINNDVTINKKKKIMEIMDWMLSDEGQIVLNYGLENVHYKYDANGKMISLLGKDEKTGYQKTLYDDSVAPGIYRIKGLVSWSTLIPDEMEYRDEQMQLLSAWKSDQLITSPLSYCTVDTSFATTISQLNDMIEVNFKAIVAKVNEDTRQSTWNNFVKKYGVTGSSYINAMNESAKKIYN